MLGKGPPSVLGGRLTFSIWESFLWSDSWSLVNKCVVGSLGRKEDLACAVLFQTYKQSKATAVYRSLLVWTFGQGSEGWLISGLQPLVVVGCWVTDGFALVAAGQLCGVLLFP